MNTPLYITESCSAGLQQTHKAMQQQTINDERTFLLFLLLKIPLTIKFPKKKKKTKILFRVRDLQQISSNVACNNKTIVH